MKQRKENYAMLKEINRCSSCIVHPSYLINESNVASFANNFAFKLLVIYRWRFRTYDTEYIRASLFESSILNHDEYSERPCFTLLFGCSEWRNPCWDEFWIQWRRQDAFALEQEKTDIIYPSLLVQKVWTFLSDYYANCNCQYFPMKLTGRFKCRQI